ncbi:MAG: glutamate formimidoyltransferase [Bryobacterales bacterium]|nr:glutamate formimidoyltransferase [Bryobacterales bacterium]
MIVETVPNFSEGRNRDTVEAIALRMGDCVLDWSLDADHHRCVITAAGDRGELFAAVMRGAEQAVETIDLRTHRGVHPRVGALDVLPFVPLRGAAMQDCAELAVEAGEQLWQRFGIPVFLYGEAARLEERRNLAMVRREIKLDARAKPDIGDAAGHKTAGVTVVGARYFLIAYNVNLATGDVSAAKAIAAKMRAIPHVKALGLHLAGAGVAQVSMNLTDYRVTGIGAAFEAVRREAEALGIAVSESELIGMAPPDALNDDIAARVRLRAYRRGLILPKSLF